MIPQGSLNHVEEHPMKRVLVVVGLVAAVLAVPGSASAGPGGPCDGRVDVLCRTHVCQPDELDCGMIPPCLVWVAGKGCIA